MDPCLREPLREVPIEGVQAADVGEVRGRRRPPAV